MPSHVSSSSDAAAREMLAMARLQALNAMFTGTKLKFGAKSAISAVAGMADSGRTIASNAKKLAKGGSSAAAGAATNSSSTISMVNDFISGCADVPGLHSVAEAIGTEAMENLVAEVIPFVGIVNSARKLATATARVVDDAHSLYKSAEWTEGALPGDPVAACEAVKSLIKRDLGKHSIQVAQQAAATGGKLAGILGDGGTGTTVAIGLANAAASLGLQLFYLGLDSPTPRWSCSRAPSPRLSPPSARVCVPAEPAVRGRLCAAIARTPRGGGWLASLIASSSEPLQVRAAAAWCARGLPGARSALEIAARGPEGPLAANARAALAARRGEGDAAAARSGCARPMVRRSSAAGSRSRAAASRSLR